MFYSNGLKKSGLDNRFGSTVLGGGGFLLTDEITIAAGQLSNRNSFKLLAIQPGNNFLVGATNHYIAGTPAYMYLNITNQVSLDGWRVTAANSTEVLTVWRTLHIEQDSMGPPSASDLPFAADDVPVGDVREANLGMLGSRFVRANIDIAADLAQYETRVGTSDDTFFIMNLGDSLSTAPGPVAADGMRDVENVSQFWSVQVVGSYDAGILEDHDGETVSTAGTTTYTYGGYAEPTCFVFLETIRDYSVADGSDAIIQEMRTVVHEVGHTFLGPHGNPGADEGIMNTDIMFDGNDAENHFTIKSLGLLQSKLRPQAGELPVP